MPRDKLTMKQEKFCRKYIELGNASEAYRLSYDAKNMKPETVNRTAKELIDNPKISARVEQLREIHQKRHEVTVDSITNELREIAMEARTDRQFAPAVSAVMGKAKLHGLVMDKHQIEDITGIADKMRERRERAQKHTKPKG